MADLVWKEVRDYFDPEQMGMLPDGCVADTTAEDWETLFAEVKASSWAWEYTVGGQAGPMPVATAMLARSRGPEGITPQLCVWPAPEVAVIFRPWSDTDIEFDVDLRYLQGQSGVDILCGFMAWLGRTLGRPVALGPEGGSEPAFLRYDPVADRVFLVPDP